MRGETGREPGKVEKLLGRNAGLIPGKKREKSSMGESGLRCFF